ncbi:MAG: GAF domain-containing protein [Deltaproteobacteria bacterium]|nr:GAF domain-containing protein [Deltaproteobacteria bacterium]
MTLTLRDIRRAAAGIVPGTVATCSADGEPNVSYISQLEIVDDRHVALSRQFFNKTSRNLDENPLARVQLHDPVTFEPIQLRLRFCRSETSGPLFESMSSRIDAIASHTGMRGVFRLVSADVFEVLEIRSVDGFFVSATSRAPEHAEPVFTEQGALTELRALQLVCERINRAHCLESMLAETLAALDELHGFRYSMVLVPDESRERLVTIASHGYGAEGIGAEVALEDGLIGMAAAQRRALRTHDLEGDLRYGRAIRERVFRAAGATRARPEIPLPGLPNARAQIALPLVVRDRLVGVLAVESRDPSTFDEWHERYLDVVAHQIALGIEHHGELDDTAEAKSAEPERPSLVGDPSATRRTFVFYRNDDCVFVDGEYLIRNVPGLVLWKVLSGFAREGRSEYTNRELRLDPSLKLPAGKDNLESRLILLRKRLEQKCPDVRLARLARGRFRLELDRPIALVERDTA